MVDAPTEPRTSRNFEPQYFAPLFAAEPRHFWFNARNRVIADLVRQITTNLPTGYRVLEVGCGTGNVLRILDEVCGRGTAVGMDLFIEGLRFARRRTRCPLVQGDMHAPPFGVLFDVIGLFDVLEHLPDDARVLRDLHAMLAPGGALLLTVPASMSLWSYIDEVGHHCLRYEPDGLEGKLREAGYTVEYLTPFMTVLFPLMWLRRRAVPLLSHRSAVKQSDDTDPMVTGELRIVPVLNVLLSWFLRQEARFITRRKRLWIGTSLLAIARKAAPLVEN